MRFRLATFNLENLGAVDGPPLAERIRALRPQLLRLDADVLCLQEVHGQKPKGARRRRLLALDRLLEGTPYAAHARVASHATDRDGETAPADLHNLVVLSRLPILGHRQIRHELVSPPLYRAGTADPPPAAATPITFDRPFLHLVLDLAGRPLHVLNLHLRAPLAAPVPGQKAGPSVWRSCAGWAEGFFLAAVKRSAQALEARLLVDRLFDAEPEALIAVVGDLNAETFEVPVRLLLAEPGDTGNGSLAPRALVPLERALPGDRRFSVIHHGRRVMLDHILVSRPLLALFRHLEVHSETLGDEVEAALAVTDASESHHAPLVAEFALPDPDRGGSSSAGSS